MELLVRLRELCGSCSRALEQSLVRSDPIHHVGGAPMLLMRRDPDSAVCLAHSMLHSQRFSDVPLAWRRYYEEAQLWGVAAAMAAATRAASSAHLSDHECAELCLNSIVRRLDLALIMTGAPGRYPLIQQLLDALQPVTDQASGTDAGLGCSTAATSVRPLGVAAVGTDAGRFIAPQSRGCRQVKEPGNSGLQTTARRFPRSHRKSPSLANPVTHLVRPSIDEFRQHWRTSDSPAILSDALTHWNALSCWNDPLYWMQLTLGGRRLIPVEVGSSYTNDDWGQKIMNFQDFLQTYMLNGNGGRTDAPVQAKGYLAQHDLLRQVPRLHGDIAIPDYCWVDDPTEYGIMQGSYTDDTRQTRGHGNVSGTRAEVPPAGAESANVRNRGMEDGDAASRAGSSPPTGSAGVPSATSSSAAASSAETSPLPYLNIWIGPEGTVSPAHTDPHHNILAQVVGRKYVRLFAPSQNSRLYPMAGGKGEVTVADKPSHSAESITQADRKRKRRDSDPEATERHRLGGQEAQACPPSQQVGNNSSCDDQKSGDEEALTGVNMSNTSSVDVGLSIDWPLGTTDQSAPDKAEDLYQRRLQQARRYPLFEDAEYVETVLHPGQCLFIPRGWWHYITSLDVSCSVSFWWD